MLYIVVVFIRFYYKNIINQNALMHKVNPVVGTLQSLHTLLLNICSCSDIVNNMFGTTHVFVSVFLEFFIELKFVRNMPKTQLS